MEVFDWSGARLPVAFGDECFLAARSAATRIAASVFPKPHSAEISSTPGGAARIVSSSAAVVSSSESGTSVAGLVARARMYASAPDAVTWSMAMATSGHLAASCPYPVAGRSASLRSTVLRAPASRSSVLLSVPVAMEMARHRAGTCSRGTLRDSRAPAIAMNKVCHSVRTSRTASAMVSTRSCQNGGSSALQSTCGTGRGDDVGSGDPVATSGTCHGEGGGSGARAIGCIRSRKTQGDRYQVPPR